MSLGSPGIRCQPGETLPLPLQMWPWDPPGQTRTSRTGAPTKKESGHLCYQAHGGTRVGAPATRQLLHVGMARSPLGLRKAPDEDADGERDFLDGFGFTCLLCVDPFDKLGIALEVEEIFRGDGRANPPGKHSLLNAREEMMFQHPEILARPST